MSLWRQTVWGRVPAALARPAVYRSLATTAALAVLPAAYMLWQRHTLVHPLAAFAFRIWFGMPDAPEVWAGMSPDARAVFPAKIESFVERLLPDVLVTTIVLALTAALACLWMGRFLRRQWNRAQDRPTAGVTPRAPIASACLAAATGFLAHLPFLARGFNADEATWALHMNRGWLAWASTWDGWAVHMGGELLGRLASAAFGPHEFLVRLPAAALSAAGMGIVHRWVEERHDALTAWLTTGLLCALPLWAEQTTLLRGYGLMFFAAAWNSSALWRILDRPIAGTETRVLAAFFVSLLLGLLAHFFFVFYALAVLLLLAWRARADRNACAVAALAWGAVALVPIGLLYVPGLPMVFYETTWVNHVLPIGTFIGESLAEMTEELGFRLVGIAPIAASMLVGCWLWGVWRLDRTSRARVLTIVGLALGLPVLLRPVAFSARFFIFLLPFLFPAALPVAGLLRRIPVPSLRTAAAAILLIVLWAAPTWRNGPNDVDIRELCTAIDRLARPGSRVVIDRYLTSARACLPDRVNARYVNAALSLAPAADIVTVRMDDGPVPPGFVEAARIPGKWWSVIIYRRQGALS